MIRLAPIALALSLFGCVADERTVDVSKQRSMVVADPPDAGALGDIQDLRGTRDAEGGLVWTWSEPSLGVHQARRLTPDGWAAAEVWVTEPDTAGVPCVGCASGAPPAPPAPSWVAGVLWRERELRLKGVEGDPLHLACWDGQDWRGAAFAGNLERGRDRGRAVRVVDPGGRVGVRLRGLGAAGAIQVWQGAHGCVGPGDGGPWRAFGLPASDPLPAGWALDGGRAPVYTIALDGLGLPVVAWREGLWQGPASTRQGLVRSQIAQWSEAGWVVLGDPAQVVADPRGEGGTVKQRAWDHARHRPALAVGADGAIWVGRYVGYGLAVRVWRDGAWSSAPDLHGAACQTRLAALPDGRVLAAWTAPPDSTRPNAQARVWASLLVGTVWRGPWEVGVTGPGRHPVVSWDDRGEPVVAWVAPEGRDGQVRVAGCAPTGCAPLPPVPRWAG